MNDVCPKCGKPLPEQVRAEFCPVCTLQGALNPGVIPPPPLQRVGDYELVEEIARGGAGLVYRARQISLGRDVAIKLLLAGQFANATARQRFRTEAAIAAKLRHPQIVTIIEVGDYEGQPWLAMELMEGGTLADRLRTGPLPAREAAAVVAKLARAVQVAHEAGVLHRDLKPSNILLDAFGEPRITDFGLAKLLSADSEMTLSGQVLGSPSFMAPEQATGRNADVSVQTDVYSLGAILYQLLTARPPFQSDSTAATLRLVENTDPVAPRRLNPNVPGDIETIALKCLEKSPARRYESAKLLAEDLDRFVGGRPVHARPLGPVGRAWRWSKRRKGLAVSLLLLVILAIGSMLAAIWIRRAELAAVAGFSEARSNLGQARLNAYAGDLALADRAIEDGDLARTRELLERHIPAPGETDLRTFEWRLLWQNSADESVAALRGHEHVVSSVKFLDGGLRLASGSWDGTVKIWSVSNSVCERTLTEYKGRIWSVDVSPDGQHLLASGENGVVVWKTGDWTVLPRIKGSFGYGMAMFLPDSKRIAVGWRKGAGVWDLERGVKVATLKDATSPLAISPDGSLLASRNGRSLTLFDTKTWSVARRHTTGALLSFGLSDLAFSPDGKRLVVGDSRGFAGVIDLDGSDSNVVELVRTRARPQPHLGWVSQIAFTPDGRRFVTVGADQKVIVWRSDNLRPSTSFRGHRHEVWSVACSPDGELMATGGKDEVIRLWNLRAPRGPHRIVNLPNTLGSWSEHEVLTTASGTNVQELVLQVRDLKTRATNRELTIPISAPAKALFYQPATRDLALAGTNGEACVWQLSGPRPERRFVAKLPPSEAVNVCLSPDGGTVAVYEQSTHGVGFWNVSDGRKLATQSQTGGIIAMSTKFAVGVPTWEKPVLIDVRTGAKLAQLNGHKENVPTAVFLPGDQVLVTGCWDGALRFWEIPTGRLIKTARSQRQGIYALAVSPDGRTLAAAGQDGTTRFWNTDTRQETMRWIEREIISRVWFAPDGNTLIESIGNRLHLLTAPALTQIKEDDRELTPNSDQTDDE